MTVLDAYQGRGLGSCLLRRLVAAAREREVKTFRATLYVDNVPMRRLLEDVGPVTVIERNGPVITLDVSLEEEEHVSVPPPPEKEEEPPEDTPMRRILSATARGAASLVEKFRWNDHDEDQD